MSVLGIDFERLSKLSPDRFGTIFTTLSGNTVKNKWKLIDCFVLAEDNPEYEERLAAIIKETDIVEASYKKYIPTARIFPVSRRRWQYSPDLYYTVASIETEDGKPASAVQDALLQSVADRIAIDDIPEGGIREWLRDEVKKVEKKPITKTKQIDATITTINGQRYILADEIPQDVNTVKVKYTVTIEYETSELEAETEAVA